MKIGKFCIDYLTRNMERIHLQKKSLNTMFVITFCMINLNIKFVDPCSLCFLVLNLVEIRLILSNFVKISYFDLFWIKKSMLSNKTLTKIVQFYFLACQDNLKHILSCTIQFYNQGQIWPLPNLLL